MDTKSAAKEKAKPSVIALLALIVDGRESEVPEELLKIARQFIAGFRSFGQRVPLGRAMSFLACTNSENRRQFDVRFKIETAMIQKILKPKR